MASRLATAALALGVMHSSVVAALGLGELRLQSFLNEPLTATVDILNTGGLHEDQIRVRLATAEDFDKLGIDRAYFLTSVKFEIRIEDGEKGKIIVTSEDPVLEPYLDFLIEARWPNGRLLREYTILVDPPAFDTESPAVSAGQRVAETEGGVETAKKKTQDPAASSGTQVATQRPGQGSEQRNFGSEASSAPLPGDEYMIRRDETLWGIALKAKPEGTSVHQTMLDIQRMNPEAFIDGNINRIKAGYVIKLPDSGDISSNDTVSAEEAVRLQNKHWRENVASERETTSGPSLRISAEPTASDDAASGQDTDYPVSSVSTDGSASAESSAQLEQERIELAGRLSSMEEQVATLENIVSLKNDQIAALQAALEEAEATASGAMSSAEQAGVDLASDQDAALQLAKEASDSQPQQPAELTPEVGSDAGSPAAAAPVTKSPVEPAPAPVAEEGGNTLSYILGLAAAAVLGLLVFFRRRNSKEAAEAHSEELSQEVFTEVKPREADRQLKEVEQVAVPEPAPRPEIATAPEPAPELELAPEQPDGQEPEGEPESPVEGGRGYGERKHDEYASDEAGDALAEADIYIAYGRYSQAVELLETAIKNEPRNPDYRVKLVEVSAEMGNREAAQEQFEELRIIGDAVTISRAENILGAAGNDGERLRSTSSPSGGIDLTADTGEVLEAEFGDLEIEMTDIDAPDDDLDLSADFVDPAPVSDTPDEDIVFAADGDEMSTKLDLARAYLDMGDEDGARLILEEVVVEGGSGQVDEAKVLLDRLG